MSRMRFSPLEEGVLSLIGSRWWSLEELQRELFPEFPPEMVKAAVGYLRRNSLIIALERQHGTPMYESTQLGVQVLAEYRRERMSKGRLRAAVDVRRSVDVG
jgi:hypothetical protein